MDVVHSVDRVRIQGPDFVQILVISDNSASICFDGIAVVGREFMVEVMVAFS